jgi:hypothetical protein
MSGFRAHVATSTVLGIGYGAFGHFYLEAPPSTCLLSAGLCGLSGMLPDLDSDSGVPVREMLAFCAAVVPILMIDRFQQLGWSVELMALAGGLIYLTIRFGVGRIFKRYTVHRGMWHSLPAAASLGLLAFLVCSSQDLPIRVFKAGAVVLGFMSHLVLDEFASVTMHRGRVRLKKSSGTAFKLWSNRSWANVSTYGKLLLLLSLAVTDPILMQRFGYHDRPVPQTARKVIDHAREQGHELLR